jgi:hypothetical protein
MRSVKGLAHATATFDSNSYWTSSISKDTEKWNAELHVIIQLTLALFLWSRCSNGCL